MKLERNLFFRGHRKIVFFFNGGGGGGVEWVEGRKQEVRVGGGLRGRRVLARRSQTDKRGQIDRRGEEWGGGGGVCFVMSE